MFRYHRTKPQSTTKKRPLKLTNTMFILFILPVQSWNCADVPIGKPIKKRITSYMYLVMATHNNNDYKYSILLTSRPGKELFLEGRRFLHGPKPLTYILNLHFRIDVDP